MSRKIHNCEFCQKNFSTKSNLNYHQKTAKYCLEKRGQDISGFICNICDKEFTEKRYCQIHTEKCKKRFDINSNLEIKTAKQQQFLEDKERIIQNQAKQIVELQDKMFQEQSRQVDALRVSLENIAIKGATKSTSSSKTTNIIQLPLTQEWLNENAKYLTKDHIKDGISGLARYAVEFPLKNRIIVADAARKTIKFKNEQGNTVKDAKGLQTTKMVCKSIKEPATENITKIRNERIDFMANIKNPNRTITNTVIKQLDELSDMQNGINTLSEGKDHEMQNKFIDNVCTFTAS